MINRAHTFSLLAFACSCSNQPVQLTSIPADKISSVRPKVIFQPAPFPYPNSAAANNLDGRVVVRMVISSQGRVVEVMPIEGSDPFLSTVIRYAKLWKFDNSEAEYRQATLTMVYTAGRTIELKFS